MPFTFSDENFIIETDYLVHFWKWMEATYPDVVIDTVYGDIYKDLFNLFAFQALYSE